MMRILLAVLLVLYCVNCAPRRHEKSQWDKDRQHPTSSGTNDFVNDPEHRLRVDWYANDQIRIQLALQRMQQTIDLHKSAKNVIFIMGDGMGISTMSAARIYLAQSRNLTGDDAKLSWEDMPHAALSKVYTTDYLTPDSAATATALMCGEKTKISTISVNQNVTYGDCASSLGNHLKSILHHSIDEGKWTGVITNTRITHASPACTYAHSAQRNWEADSDLPDDAKGICPDIASQLIDDNLNKKIRIILGGGRRSMLPNNMTDPEHTELMGDREDGRNLIQEWQNIKQNRGLNQTLYKYVDSLQDFNDVDETQIQYLMGLFEYDHMQFETDRAQDINGEPSLVDMLEKSIKILQRSDNGYFLFVEGGRIDQAHHANLAQVALQETVMLSDTVQRALDLTNEDDTLIVVTADHSHVFTMGGYPQSHINILTYDDTGYMLSTDGKPYATLGYTNGPGHLVHRMNAGGTVEQPRINLNEIKENMTDVNYVSDAGIWLYSETHGGEDVAVFARGPMAHLFHGTQEQSYIGNVMMYASCVGRNKKLCNVGVAQPCAAQSSSGVNAHTVFMNYYTAGTIAIFLWSCIKYI